MASATPRRSEERRGRRGRKTKRYETLRGGLVAGDADGELFVDGDLTNELTGDDDDDDDDDDDVKNAIGMTN